MSAHGQQKRKRAVDDETLEELDRYSSSGSLSPISESVYPTLVELAHRSSDDGHDETLQAFAKYFIAKQEQVVETKATLQELTDKVAELESHRKEMKANFDSTLKSQDAKLKAAETELEKANLESFEEEFLFQYGDWLKEVIAHIKSSEAPNRSKQSQALRNAAVKKVIAELDPIKAGGGIPTPEELKANHKKAEAAGEIASKSNKWSCLKPTCTDALVLINEEIDAVKKWRQDGENEASAPGTPFLDRLDHASKHAGTTRAMCLLWASKYSERNEAAHNPPPRVGDFWKQAILNGELVDVPKPKTKDLYYTCIDWMKMKNAIELHKSKINFYFAKQKISQDTRDCFVALADQYWKHFCSGKDTDGNLIPTKAAKDAAAQHKAVPKISNPEKDFFKEYKKGKWDDIQ
ncbi:hypothetical protein ACHAP8_005666 [Fusarium lateritium]